MAAAIILRAASKPRTFFSSSGTFAEFAALFSGDCAVVLCPRPRRAAPVIRVRLREIFMAMLQLIFE
jgi:hypothetical protein